MTASRPRLLDLFAGAGGSARGYQLAGFHVTGIDNKPQPRYAGDLFIQADALNPPVRLEDFDVIHASPPCQAYSQAARLHDVEHPQLVDDVRWLLVSSGRPYIIENVPGSPLVSGPQNLFGERAGTKLCGRALGLAVKRHRVFESNVPLRIVTCPLSHAPYLTVFGHAVEWHDGTIRLPGTLAQAKEAMGINWMKRDELSEAIPPAYTEFLGLQLLDFLSLKASTP